MRQRLTISIVTLLMVPALFSQNPSTNEPLHLKEGLWDVTVTEHLRSSIREQDIQKALQQVPPDQREMILEALKAQQRGTEQTQQQPLCLTHDQLLSGDIFEENASCTTQQILSSGEELKATVKCGDIQRVTTIERVSNTSFKGSESTVGHDLADARTDSTFSATWASADCSSVKNPSQQAKQDDSTAPDPDVLSLLPFLPNRIMGRLGPHFRYAWAMRQYPDIFYNGDAPGLPRGTPAITFNGTDGTFLYMTLVGSGGTICIPPAILLKVDRAGQFTVIDDAPKGIHGGIRLPYYCPDKDKK